MTRGPGTGRSHRRLCRNSSPGCVLVVARPLQTAVLLEARVAHTRRAPARAGGPRSRRSRRPASPQSRPIRLASSKMMARSSRAPAGGSTALRTRWTRRSLLVTVPSDSHHAAVAGKHDVGQLRGLREEQVLDDEEVEPLEQVPIARFWSASDWTRVLADARRAPVRSPRSIASNIRDRCQPRFGGTGTPHAASNLRPQLVVLDVLEAGQTIGQARPCRRRPGRCSGRAAG